MHLLRALAASLGCCKTLVPAGVSLRQPRAWDFLLFHSAAWLNATWGRIIVKRRRRRSSREPIGIGDGGYDSVSPSLPRELQRDRDICLLLRGSHRQRLIQRWVRYSQQEKSVGNRRLAGGMGSHRRRRLGRSRRHPSSRLEPQRARLGRPKPDGEEGLDFLVLVGREIGDRVKATE